MTDLPQHLKRRARELTKELQVIPQAVIEKILREGAEMAVGCAVKTMREIRKDCPKP